MDLLEKKKQIFCATAQKNLVNFFFSSESEAGIVLNLSLIFQQISAFCPYKLGPYKKKKSVVIFGKNIRPRKILKDFRVLKTDEY